jgi:cation:H+ antiporter
VVGLGNCFPEIYFTIISAKKHQNWMILGDIMGSVIVCATLVLGVIALISPFKITDFSPFAIARIFTIVAAFFFLIVIKTGKRITKKEGLFLLSLYIAFLLSEIFFR